MKDLRDEHGCHRECHYDPHECDKPCRFPECLTPDEARELAEEIAKELW